MLIIPQILTFGRATWASIIFAVFAMIIFNIWKKKDIKVLFRQILIILVLLSTLVFCFLKFVPNSDFYVQAIGARLMQGRDEVKYDEGSFGERTVFDNEILLRLWSKSNLFFGIGMNPFWINNQESREERIIYIALCDVFWPGILAVYGMVGLAIALFFQFYYIKLSFKLIKNSKYANVLTFILITMFTKMTFDTFITYSYVFTSIGILGLGTVMSFMVAIAVFCNEKQKNEPADTIVNGNSNKSNYLYRKYYYYHYKSYKHRY